PRCRLTTRPATASRWIAVAATSASPKPADPPARSAHPERAEEGGDVLGAEAGGHRNVEHTGKLAGAAVHDDHSAQFGGPGQALAGTVGVVHRELDLPGPVPADLHRRALLGRAGVLHPGVVS